MMTKIEYTLSDLHEAESYVHLLLKVLEQVLACKESSSSSTTSSSPSSSSTQQQQQLSQRRSASRISLEAGTLSEENALQLLRDDSVGIVAQYAVTKLCEVVVVLTEMSKSSSSGFGGAASPAKNDSKKNGSGTGGSSSSIQQIFYPDGILIESWRTLLRLLVTGGTSDAFVQSTFACVYVAAYYAY